MLTSRIAMADGSSSHPRARPADQGAGVESVQLYKLMAWLSPAYPIGSYTYSHGIETAVAGGAISDTASTEDWIRDCVGQGAGRNDAILLAHAWRAESDMINNHLSESTQLDELTQLAEALAPSAERLIETTAQGEAFADVTAAVWGSGGPAPYPIVVGRTAAQHGVPLAETLLAYSQAFAANLVSAAVRLVPLGQAQGQGIVARLMPDVLDVAKDAAGATLDDLGGLSFGADIASMHHETQDVRLFRT